MREGRRGVAADGRWAGHAKGLGCTHRPARRAGRRGVVAGLDGALTGLRHGRVLPIVLCEYGHAAEYEDVVDSHPPPRARGAQAELGMHDLVVEAPPL